MLNFLFCRIIQGGHQAVKLICLSERTVLLIAFDKGNVLSEADEKGHHQSYSNFKNKQAVGKGRFYLATG